MFQNLYHLNLKSYQQTKIEQMDVHLDTAILMFLIEFCQNMTNTAALRSSIITFVSVILEKNQHHSILLKQNVQ